MSRDRDPQALAWIEATMVDAAPLGRAWTEEFLAGEPTGERRT